LQYTPEDIPDDAKRAEINLCLIRAQPVNPIADAPGVDAERIVVFNSGRNSFFPQLGSQWQTRSS